MIDFISNAYCKIFPLWLRRFIFNIRRQKLSRFLFLPLFPLVIFFSSFNRLRCSCVRKIIVFNLGGIGDNLLSTPALKALSKKFPNADITVIVTKKEATYVYINNPIVKKTLYLEYFFAWSIAKLFVKKYFLFFDLLRVFIYYPILTIKILLKNYDLGINFYISEEEGGTNFCNLFLYLCGIPKRVGSYGFYRKLLTHKKDLEIIREKHWIDIYIEIIKTLGMIEEVDKNLEFFVSNNDKKFAEYFLNINNISKEDLLIGISPGGDIYLNSKRWPFERFAETINKLYLKYNFKVILFGTENEKELIYKLNNLLVKKPILAVGLGLNKVASLLNFIKIFLTNDNGLLHLSNALKVPYIISIFGPTNPKRIVLQDPRNICISAKTKCAPCIELSTGDESKKCKNYIKEECLLSISVDEVYKELEKIMYKIFYKNN